MRTLNEIVEDLIDGQKPTHDECYYALQTYRAMFNIDHRNYRESLLNKKREPSFIREMKANNSFHMYKNALNKSPKEWLNI